jgi:hypothetical protein
MQPAGDSRISRPPGPDEVLGSSEPEIDDADEEEEEPWPTNPVRGAEELLRFSRIRQLLQP